MKRLFAVLGLLACLMSVALAQDQSATNLYRPTATPPNPPCPYSRLYMNLSGEMSLVSCTGTVTVIGSGGGGSGTVTSVALSMPAIFTVSGSPVTSSGTLTAALASQSANLVFAGPTTGSAAAPTFRSLVAADVPNLDAAKITTGTIATAQLGSGTASSSTFLRGDQTWAVPTFTISGLMEAINAKRDYACVGDDTANDTTCLTNAINAAKATTGKQLYIPAGTYKTTAKLTIPGGVTIIGDGREKTVIHGTANDVVLDLVQGTGSFAFKGPVLQAIGVRGSSAGANQIGINVDDALYFEDVVLESVQVSATGSHGIYFGNVFSSKFTDIRSGGMNSGYPFLFNQLNMPGNLFESLYAGDVNSTHPAGYRIRTGDILCIACNGINASSSNSWWAIVGDKNGTDGATSNRSAYLKCLHCNIESSKAGGILHYYNSTSDIDGRSLFAGDASASGTFIALKYEIDTSSGEIPSSFQRGRIGPLVTFANSPLSYYANSEVIHANDLPPVAIEGDTRQADGTIITSYRNTTNSRSEKIYRLDARKPITTITANASYTQPGATNFEVNCALGCTLTLPWAGYYGSREEFIYVRNIGAGTAVVAANSGGTMNGGANYSLSTGESVVFLPHSASADYRQVGLGGSGAANRIAFFNDIQHFSSNSGFTYDGTTVLNSRAGGNPYFAANDTSAGITTRFGPLAGAPDRAIIGTTSNHPLGLYANNAERWTISTSGHLLPGAASSYNIGSASLPVNDFTLSGKLCWSGTTVCDLSGSGSPEGAVTAGIGSVYRRTNGSTGTTLYVKEAGTGNTGWSAVGGGGGSGLTNLNGLTAGTQSFAVGTSGTDFAISSATSTHTFNLPDAGASARGVVTTGSQTFAGAKTVTSVFTANPGTTPTTAILVDIASLGSAGTRDSNWLVFRGRSNDGTTHLTEWKQVVDVNTNAGGSNLSFQTRIDAASFTEVMTISDAGDLSANDIAGATISASVGFGGDGSGLTNLDASQLITGTVASTRGGAGTINGILQANGSGVVSAVTVGAGLSFSGGTLNTVAGNPSTQIGLTATNGVATSFMRSDAAPALNVGISPTWTGSHVFTTTTVAREIDPQTDNTYDLGTTSLRWKTVHVGPGSVVVHNDATNTLKATLGFTSTVATLSTDASSPLQLKVGSTNGVYFNTSGKLGFGTTGTPDGDYDFRQLANGSALLNLRRFTDTSPTGSLIQAQNAAGAVVYNLDVTGTMTIGTIPAARISSGTIAAANGGTGQDTSGSTGMPLITAGTWSVITTTGSGSAVRATSPDFTTGATIGGVAIPTISSTNTLTNKTISGASNTLSNIGNASLTNSTITIAGTATSLGSSISLDTIIGLSSTGLVKRTGANTFAIAVAGTDYLTTNASITLSGDVSGSGTTAITTTIGASKVTNSMLAGSITDDKLNQITTADKVADSALSTNVPLLNGANTFTAAQVMAVDDATTNNFVNLLDLRHSTSGTPATGLGGSIRFGLESTTTVNRDAGRINVQWTTATDATRTSSMTFQLVNSAAALTTLLTIAGNGDLAAIGNITSGSVAVPTISSTSTFTNKTLTSSTNVLGGVTMTLGSDATGDIYYRNSGGVLTRLAAGSTSADLMVVSGLPSWKRRVFSIIAYGAACDGATTNDRAAIQSAIDAAGAAGGGVVSFEGCTSGTRIDTGLTIGDGSGTYSTGTATASTYNDITIDGASAKLRWYGSAGGTVFTVNGPFYRLKIRDMFINMKPSTNSAGIALDLNHVLLSEFSNIYINENSDYGIRIRAYGGWSGGDGANGNKFDNITINSTTAGAKGIDIGYTAICTGCTLDPAQNQFNNFRARFDTGVGTYVSGSIGINLNFTDASQFNNPIIAAATALQITVPTGTGGASYPSAYMFTNPALTGTSSFAVSGTWTAAEKLGFYNYEVGDAETIPSDTNNNTFGVTSNGVRWGMSADAGFITGLQLEWVSTTQVKIKTGAAQIQSTGEIVTLASDSTISPTLSASAWHYCYLYLNSGTPTVECVTTAPTTAWFGTARSKTSATERRYIGAIKTNGSSQIYEFYHNAATNFYQWGEVTTASPFRVLSGGTATTETSVDCTAVVPATGRAAQLRMINTEPVGGQILFVRSRTGGPNQLQLRVNSDLITPIVLTSAQLFYYIYGSAPSTGATYIDVVGYYDNR